jgi:hypothetical protein
MGPDTRFVFVDEQRLASEEYHRVADDQPLKRVIVIRCAETGRILAEAEEFPSDTRAPNSHSEYKKQFEKTGTETVFTDAVSNQPLGWYPEALSITEHLDRDVTVGYGNWSLHVLRVEQG